MSLDDTTLMAYVDGALDPRQVHGVETALFHNPELRAKTDAMRRSASLARAALNSTVDEAVPDRILDAVRSASESHPLPPIRRWPWWRRTRMVATFAVLAAVFAVGLTGGYLIAQGRVAQNGPIATIALEGAERALRNAAFQEALEFKRSGLHVSWADSEARGQITPVRTFKNNRGQFCREFREVTLVDRSKFTTFGVACRRAGMGWNETYRMIPAADGGQGI